MMSALELVPSGMAFQFRPGARVPANVSPKETYDELIAIREKRGALTAEAVAADYEDLRDEHPLAWAFTSDVSAGMHKLHVYEAGHLIRSLVVTKIVPEHTTPVRALMMVRDEAMPTYEPTSIVLSAQDKTQTLLEQIDAAFDSIDRKRREVLELLRLMQRDGGSHGIVAR